MNGDTNNLLPEIHQIASGTGWFIASYSEQIIKTTLCASHFQTYRKPDISWKRFAFQHKNHKGRQRIGLRKDGQGNLLHPRSHPHCNQAAPCVCASVQPPHQTGQRCGSIGCSFFTSFKRKGPTPHGVEPFSKLFNYFKILRGSGLFIQHELSINRLLFQAFHLLAL